ncbi:hypothetical protein K457DRAFT_313043 [Linnemannia elongata AG-77]|uniref:Uncharacterized protein n=1 Tax=Linnemannia elongata AG-77 TaxID=1314771 RepID=A0A197JBR8_9FUNG|nr:hypothetical protein K457DRAFT_313043 [Linnemannia elongata AG-77]
MTSSSEIHVQEVLNNLSNTIKRDAEIVDGSSFTAAIAQQDATALPTSLAAELPVTLSTELSSVLASENSIKLIRSSSSVLHNNISRSRHSWHKHRHRLNRMLRFRRCRPRCRPMSRHKSHRQHRQHRHNRRRNNPSHCRRHSSKTNMLSMSTHWIQTTAAH